LVARTPDDQAVREYGFQRSDANVDFHENPMSRPPDTTHPDLAAHHARALLQTCGLSIDIPNRDRPESAAVEWARSGAMWLTGPADGAPRFAAGALASAARGAGLALRALAPQTALASLDAPALLAERAAIDGLRRQGDISAGGSARLLATQGGCLALNLPRDEDWQLTPAWLSTDESAFASARDWKSLERLIANRDGTMLVERGRMMGMAVAGARKSVARDRPLFTIRHASEKSPIQALRRIRLLDLSNLWAGPLATSLLAMAGVEVLKIESPTRPDGARLGSEAFFRLMNGNKQGCAIDLHEPCDRAFFERLLEHADVVVESARPRALAQLGFDASNWVSASPGRIWASITGYGRSNEWIAFGDDAAIAAGLAWSPEPDEARPCFCADAIADPIAGLHVAAIVLAHLRAGRGGLFDLSLTDIVAHAASLTHDGLVLPIEARQPEWFVVEDGHSTRVERPRARIQQRQAPVLAAPDEKMLAEWGTTC
jgi:crotonobetainyl-CoA:carnitine CoA-transferase CaiB-like acyl-CoA transferase